MYSPFCVCVASARSRSLCGTAGSGLETIDRIHVYTVALALTPTAIESTTTSEIAGLLRISRRPYLRFCIKSSISTPMRARARDYIRVSSELDSGRHLFAQAQRAHVRPDHRDIVEALFLCSSLAGVLPARRERLVSEPDRVLLFVIHNGNVGSCIFGSVIHKFAPISRPCERLSSRVSTRHKPYSV